MINNFHLKQLNKVLDYINENLDQNIDLDKIAAVGNYSKYHFHRIFKSFTKESLHQYIIRKRVEKIAALLIRDSSKSINNLSIQYGFNSNSTLTKTFKKIYGISPTQFRKLRKSPYDKITYSKNGQQFNEIESYFCHINNYIDWIYMNSVNIEIVNLPQIKIAYVNHIGIKDLNQSFFKIINWGLQNNIVKNKEFDIVRIYNDSFKITSPDKVRMNIGIIIEKEITTENVHFKSIPPGNYVKGSFILDINDFETAWTSMYMWINENSHQTIQQDPFEIIHNNYQEHPEKKCIVDLYIRIEK